MSSGRSWRGTRLAVPTCTIRINCRELVANSACVFTINETERNDVYVMNINVGEVTRKALASRFLCQPTGGIRYRPYNNTLWNSSNIRIANYRTFGSTEGLGSHCPTKNNSHGNVRLAKRDAYKDFPYIFTCTTIILNKKTDPCLHRSEKFKSSIP